MKKYIICTEDNQDDLMKAVNKAMDQGYVPHGSMSVVFWENPESWEYNQPMIHKDAIPQNAIKEPAHV